ncbi:beta-ketoacyl synthase N-terminal-like domain-containing protein [Desulfosediminicola flagellatus]|uniref:beta-ketoacyl synthase N-terminal-like domain-containing protein n=1 Tax=Desulfosediminicola flagellatus TaxID=2569541 RepID=UPI0010AD14DD|nr:beta-ketoacyl synthase N-terminal-like domain-containing protein [Desulfosediminicola flagellatus]
MRVQITKQYTNFLSQLATPQELARNLRRADDFIRLGVVAGYETIRPIRETKEITAERCGLILGTSFGPMETNFDVLDQVVNDQPTSPILFSHSVFNSTAGYMATSLDIKGCGLTVTDFAFPFFRALEHGYLTIVSGRLDCCLVIQVETYSTLLQESKNRFSTESKNSEWPAGVVCWLLENTDTTQDNRYSIKSLSIESSTSMDCDYLPFKEELTVNAHTAVTSDPLGSSVLLTAAMNEQPQRSSLQCNITAPYGAVNIHLHT